MDVQAARELVSGASRIVGFTGAGISTESGVPDFRSPNGVWAQNRIVDFQEFISSEAGRIEYWRQKALAWPAMRDAQPNAGHYAFVELHRQGRLDALITQNIERLHQRSGLPADKVLELHGTTTEAVCLACGDRITSDEACRRIEGGEKAPRCRVCGGFLKPATISFGQAMPHDVMVRAQVAAETCDLMIAVGSSLVVCPRHDFTLAASGRRLAETPDFTGDCGRECRSAAEVELQTCSSDTPLVVEPAASIPRVARQAGARLIIVNRDATPLDGIADAVVHGEIGAVLPELVRRDG